MRAATVLVAILLGTGYPRPDANHAGPSTAEEAEDRLARTSDFWHEWLSRGEFTDLGEIHRFDTVSNTFPLGRVVDV